MEMLNSVKLERYFLDSLKLTDEVKRFNQQIEKLSERAIDVRLVRIEATVEISQKQLPKR